MGVGTQPKHVIQCTVGARCVITCAVTMFVGIAAADQSTLTCICMHVQHICYVDNSCVCMCWTVGGAVLCVWCEFAPVWNV